MSLRTWIRTRVAQESRERAGDSPVAALVYSIVKEDELPHALGEWTAATYPEDLAGQLRRRNQVAAELRGMDIATREGRRAHLARLVELLHIYPHLLAYEALVLAYADHGRWDDARGVAFAARERRWEVEHSPHPEIRGEVDRLKTWTPEEVDDLRREALGELVTPGVPSRAAEPAPALAPEITPALA